MSRALRAAAAALFSLALPAAAQRGAIVQPRNLADLTAQAATIVHGRVMSVSLAPVANLPSLTAVVVTLRVEDSLKGTPGATITFRQFLWDARDRADTAGYRKGQELVLLLNPVTPYGLTSPAGLDQGRFLIRRDAQGVAYAANAFGNGGLFRGMAPQLARKGVQLSPRLAAIVSAERPGPIRLDDLLALLKAIAGPTR